jgi:hypothetical protein
MDSPVPDSDDSPELELDLSDDRVPRGEKSWLSEIADQLESNPQECWQAFESLQNVEPALRLSIIDELSGLGSRPGAEVLLRLLSSARDPATRAAARSALGRLHGKAREALRFAPPPTSAVNREALGGWRDHDDKRSLVVPAHAQRVAPRLTRCLVTSVDGQGRGSIVVSVNQSDQRRTAAFLCDVRQGICDVVGEVEPESPGAGSLIDALDQQPDGECARDIPELALGLLAGSLMLCKPTVPPSVRDWLLSTLGPGFQPAGFPATIPGLDPSSLAQAEMPARAVAVLDACPSWLDSSPLTFELAEEIWLRERRTAADPDRDAGAYRFLFEHRLIHCLELYQRMLLWMAWLWKFLDKLDLSRSALALGYQLSDEQYAVPSHPFTVELTTRSLGAAQVLLETEARRSHHGGA